MKGATRYPTQWMKIDLTLIDIIVFLFGWFCFLFFFSWLGHVA